MTLTCAICGIRSHDVRPGLVAWLDPDPPFANIDRCLDRSACRSRVEATGERWPVREEVEATP